MSLIRDIKSMLTLLSMCIYFDHPIILNTRRLFHIRVAELSGNEAEEDLDLWENRIRQSCKYSLSDFLRVFIKDELFRRRIIDVMDYEINLIIGRGEK